MIHTADTWDLKNIVSNYGRKWTSDIDNFILAEVPISSKQDLLTLINNIFGTAFTKNALTTHCTESKIQLGIAKYKHSTGINSRPLWSEHFKKGYLHIKTPDGWKIKSRYIYELSHPEYVYKRGDCFIFLDGDIFNFNPDNIELCTRQLIVRFNTLGGVVKGHPELTRINLLNAKLEKAIFDKGEKQGLCSIVYTKGRYRCFKKKLADYARNRRHQMKEEDPAAYQAYLEKQRENARQYRKKLKAEGRYEEFEQKHLKACKKYNRKHKSCKNKK